MWLEYAVLCSLGAVTGGNVVEEAGREVPEREMDGSSNCLSFLFP